MPGYIPSHRVRSLGEAIASLVGVVKLEDLLGRVVESACEATGARYGALGVIGPFNVHVEFVHRGIDSAIVPLIGHLPEGRGVLGSLIRDGRTIMLNNLADHPDSAGFPDNHPPMASFLGVPIGHPDGAFGNLYLTEKDGGFDEDDVVVVEALAAVAAAAVETVSLRRRLGDLAIIEDRQRIGRDLHDSIIQDLFGTGLQLQGLATTAGDGFIREGLNEASDRIDRTIDALREVVNDLIVGSGETDFANFLRGHLNRLSEPYGVGVKVSLTPGDLRLDDSIAESIRPIVMEAVSNCLRHAESDSVDVRVELLGDQLLISVTDQGVGFEPTQERHGMGLDNLKERARTLGGETTIRSVLGVGTVVEITVPVRNEFGVVGELRLESGGDALQPIDDR
jgi:two-component system, NarL family, sensor histidine kinase DevS